VHPAGSRIGARSIGAGAIVSTAGMASIAGMASTAGAAGDAGGTRGVAERAGRLAIPA
jgi:hypothetical protein